MTIDETMKEKKEDREDKRSSWNSEEWSETEEEKQN